MANPTTVTLTLGPVVIPSWSGGSVVGSGNQWEDASDATYASLTSGQYAYAPITSGALPEDAYVTDMTVTVRATTPAGGSCSVFLLLDTEGNFDYFISTFHSLDTGGPTNDTEATSPVWYEVPDRFFSGEYGVPEIAFECSSGSVQVHKITVDITYEHNPATPPTSPPTSNGMWRLAGLTPGDPVPGIYRMQGVPTAAVGMDIYCFNPYGSDDPFNVGWNGRVDDSIDEYWPLSKKLDTVTGVWTTVADPPGGESYGLPQAGSSVIRWRHAFTWGSNIVLLGHSSVGQSRSGGSFERYVATYAPGTNTWTATSWSDTDLGSQVQAVHSAGMANGRVVLDMRSGNFLSYYDIPTDTWTHFVAGQAWQSGAFNSGACGLNGKIYFARGESGNTLHVYDVASNTWSETSAWDYVDPGGGSMRGDPILLAVDNRIWVIGGYTSQPEDGDLRYATDVDAYNPLTDTWESLADIPFGLAEGGSATVNGFAWIITGYYSEPLAHPENQFGPPYPDLWSTNTVYTNAPLAAGVFKVLTEAGWHWVGCCCSSCQPPAPEPPDPYTDRPIDVKVEYYTTLSRHYFSVSFDTASGKTPSDGWSWRAQPAYVNEDGVVVYDGRVYPMRIVPYNATSGRWELIHQQNPYIDPRINRITIQSNGPGGTSLNPPNTDWPEWPLTKTPVFVGPVV